MNLPTQWQYPNPRKGFKGIWDNFVGPGATRAENALALMPAALATIALICFAYFSDLGWTRLQYVIAALLAFDIVAGVVTNATTSAKRWYHRQSQHWRKHIAFVAIHGFHIFLVAWLFRNMDIVYFITSYLLLILSSAAVITVQQRIQRSVALLLVCNAILISQYVFSPTSGFEWFMPLLFIKLLVSHLTLEEPYK